MTCAGGVRLHGADRVLRSTRSITRHYQFTPASPIVYTSFDFYILVEDIPRATRAPVRTCTRRSARRIDPLVLPALATPPHISTVTTADDGWYRSITSFAQHTAWLQGAMKLYTLAGIALLCLMALYAWWTARARADHAAMAAVAWLVLGTVISIGGGLLLKQVFQENRPCQAMHVVTVEACPGAADYSFPSDHTTFAAALAVGLWLVNRRLGIIAAALALLEAFSRVYLGQHYPHDVLAGIVLSSVVLLVGWQLARRPLIRLLDFLVGTPLRPLFTSAPAQTATAAATTAAPHTSSAPQAARTEQPR